MRSRAVTLACTHSQNPHTQRSGGSCLSGMHTHCLQGAAALEGLVHARVNIWGPLHMVLIPCVCTPAPCLTPALAAQLLKDVITMFNPMLLEYDYWVQPAMVGGAAHARARAHTHTHTHNSHALTLSIFGMT